MKTGNWEVEEQCIPSPHPSPAPINVIKKTPLFTHFQTPDLQRFPENLLDENENEYVITEDVEKPSVFVSRTFHHKSIGENKN